MTPNPLISGADGGLIHAGNRPDTILRPDLKTVFTDRAERFLALADGHSYGDYLLFLARLSELQHQCLQDHPQVALPDDTSFILAREHRMPPLSATGWQRDSVWRAHLQRIAGGMRENAAPEIVSVLDYLDHAAVDELDKLADNVLKMNYLPEYADRLPFIAAALQVYWTYMAGTPGVAEQLSVFPDAANLCPCCGSLPVAGIVRITGEVSNLRYLHCSLCNTEWNMVRAKCSLCESADHVGYRHIEGNSDAVRAECCTDCEAYLKMMRQDKDAKIDPVADDLATLTLDMLMDEAGFQRCGPNPLFVSGAAVEV